jgi:SAM-dependent methyltransferase
MNENAQGLHRPLTDWLALNRNVPCDAEAAGRIAPFPPADLMQVVSGLTNPEHFALHGIAILEALDAASPEALADYRSILDFGCGCGRLARMFKGYEGKLVGCDIDARLVDWVNRNLTYMTAVTTVPNLPLPFADGEFECVISISIFTHLNEASQDFYLRELARVTQSGGRLFLTVHGERAMERALSESAIFEMLAVPRDRLEAASRGMAGGLHNFILQQGHLTSEEYPYGITFVPADYVHRHWGRFFDIARIVDGAIHDFQSIVVCEKR